MNVTLPSKHQWAVIGSHLVVAGGGLVAGVAFFGGLNPAQVHEASQDISRISADVTDLIGAVSSLVALAMAAYTVLKASPLTSFMRSSAEIVSDPKRIAQVQAAPIDQKADVVAIADKLPEVAGIATINTRSGQALATAVPSNTVQVAKLVGTLALAFVFAVFVVPSAFAQNGLLRPLKPVTPRTAVVAPAVAATGSSSVDPLTKLVADIEAVKAETIGGAIEALNEADADAATLTNPADPTSFHDPISHACYPAEVKFLQSLPAAAAIQAPPPFNLIVLFQRKRDFVMQVQAGLPNYLKLGCAALVGDELTIFNKTMGLIGVSVAANTLLPGLGLTLPVMP